MITLHHLDDSRSQRIVWMLEELAVDYEVRRYARDPKTSLAPAELKAVHPLGKSPVISDGTRVVAESGAIIEYLADHYGDDAWKPAAGDAYRDYVYWLHYAEGSLMPLLLLRLVFDKVRNAPMPFFAKPIARAIAGKVNRAFLGPNIALHFGFVEASLEGRSWFAGDAPSGADVQMSFPLEAALATGLIDASYPRIRDFVRRVQSRPAYRRALEAIGGDYVYALPEAALVSASATGTSPA